MSPHELYDELCNSSLAFKIICRAKCRYHPPAMLVFNEFKTQIKEQSGNSYLVIHVAFFLEGTLISIEKVQKMKSIRNFVILRQSNNADHISEHVLCTLHERPKHT